MYHIAPNCSGQKFPENVENHAYVHFCDKNFVITPGEPTPTVDCSNFRDKNFTIRCLTKFTKILCCENMELYSMFDRMNCFSLSTRQLDIQKKF